MKMVNEAVRDFHLLLNDVYMPKVIDFYMQRELPSFHKVHEARTTVNVRQGMLYTWINGEIYEIY